MSVALGVEHEKRMSRILLPFVACPVVQYFFTLSHKLEECRGKKLLNIKFVMLLHYLKHFSFSEDFSERYYQKCT